MIALTSHRAWGSAVAIRSRMAGPYSETMELHWREKLYTILWVSGTSPEEQGSQWLQGTNYNTRKHPMGHKNTNKDYLSIPLVKPLHRNSAYNIFKIVHCFSPRKIVLTAEYFAWLLPFIHIPFSRLYKILIRSTNLWRELRWQQGTHFFKKIKNLLLKNIHSTQHM